MIRPSGPFKNIGVARCLIATEASIGVRIRKDTNEGWDNCEYTTPKGKYIWIPKSQIAGHSEVRGIGSKCNKGNLIVTKWWVEKRYEKDC